MNTATPREAGSEAHDVQTRDDLAQYLSQSLPGDYKTLTGDAEVRNTSTFVKSYLIEAHHSREDPVADRLRLVFRDVARLRDASLMRATDKRGDTYFVDLRHPRFQVLHSIEVSSRTDQVFERLTGGEAAGFDHVWMPGGFLREMQRGHLTGFKFRYQTGVVGAVAIDPEDVDLETGERLPPIRGRSRFSMTVSEDATAEREYGRLLRQSAFRGRKALEQVQFMSVDDDDPADYIVNGVYSYGKVIGKGTSVGGHFLTVDAIIDAYARVITRIEEEFAVGWVPTVGGHALRGEPFVFWFPDDIEVTDLRSFADSLFSSGPPFRLFGIPHGARDERIDVEAIDLHSGDSLAFELTRNWMRVYLPRGACGNAIARLYANLQHALSSDMRLTVGNGDIDPFAV